MNIHGRTSRAIGIGWIIGFGNVGGIPATYIFLATEAPRYPTGYGVSLACVVLTMLLSVVYAGVCVWENRKIVKGRGMSGSEGSREELNSI